MLPWNEEEQSLLAPFLTVRDWSAEWKQLQAVRRRVDGSDFWDERAKTFAEKDTPDAYVADFLCLADVLPGESVFDMGCGTGDLAIPLARAGHRVTAADFSRGMLDALEGRLGQLGLGNVEAMQMSWDDDWLSRGLDPGSFDVCLASRSLSVNDLEGALLKLDALARRRVCVTISEGSSPRLDGRVLRALGLESTACRDHAYALAILADHGIRTSVSRIESERLDCFESPDDAYSYYARMVEGSAARMDPERLAQALADLREWLPGQLVEEDPDEACRRPECRKRLRMREPRIISWAFISWDKL